MVYQAIYDTDIFADDYLGIRGRRKKLSLMSLARDKRLWACLDEHLVI